MKNFLTLSDLSQEDIHDLLKLAAELKPERRSGGNRPLLAGQNLGMIFQKPSLRTRISFEVAMGDLGGSALYLSPQEIGLGERESVADVARVLSRFVDGIMARVFQHGHLEELAAAASVPVINGLSDYSHPCQALGDLLTMQEHLGRLRGVRLAYVGDGNNVCHSLLFGAGLTGMDMFAATPPGHGPAAKVVEIASALAKDSGGRVRVVEDPAVAAEGAEVLYTDVWASMGQEDEAAERETLFLPYQINRRLLERAGSEVRVMHCLPAHRGQEITDAVIDGPHSIVWDQAENRLHTQKAVLVRLIGAGENASRSG
ncbi:MAG: ornithine carbamoyltransferase [Anaerolineae bacterium]